MMIGKISVFLQKYFPSSFHSFTRYWYWKVRFLGVSLLRTKHEENKWAGKPIGEIRKSFNNLDHPHRQLIVDAVMSFQPVSKILEIGCGYGPNLYWIAKQLPDTQLIGLDINSASIEEGHQFFLDNGISNVKLICGKADELYRFGDKSFDIVFTDALLIYIGPDKIRNIISEFLRITRRALILVEWHSEDIRTDPDGLGVYYLGCWKRNYINLLKQFVNDSQIKVTKIPDHLWPDRNWQSSGFIVEVTL